MILYPTETIYALGVNALDDVALAELFLVKGRDERQTVSWLVRDIGDISYYAELSKTSERLIEKFLPGALTIVLPAKPTVPQSRQASDATIGFRISPDPAAQQVITDFMTEHNAPLTCTSANKSGEPPLPTPEAILRQLGDKAARIDIIVDDGPRSGVPSTVVKVVGDTFEIIRVGTILPEHITAALD